MMTTIEQIRAVVRDVLAHHMALHREQLADLLRYDRGVFALHNRDERLARMIGELATQVAQGLADVAELAEASTAWAKADAKCDALIDQSIALAQEHRALLQRGTAVQIAADAEKLGAEIGKVDNLIAFACAEVTKREATMKLAAKQLSLPGPIPASGSSDSSSTSGVLGTDARSARGKEQS